MKKLALFGNKSQKSGFENLAALFSLLRSHSDEISLSIQWRYFEFLRRTIDLDPAGIETFDIYDGSADLALSIGGDGLIISTPTGSTGYNLSVGGPIVAPTAKNLIIAPIAPHSLNMRPLVISEDSRIEVSTQSRADKYLLSVDGKATELPLDAKVTLRKADHSVFVVVHPGYSFIEGLRAKLLWGRDGM